MDPRGKEAPGSPSRGRAARPTAPPVPAPPIGSGAPACPAATPRRPGGHQRRPRTARRRRTGAQTWTSASGNGVPPCAHRPTNSDRSRSTVRTVSASRADSSDWGCTSATTPPGATSSVPTNRNSPASSVYAPTAPKRPATRSRRPASRAVRRESWLRNGGFPTTRSNPPAGRSGHRAGSTARASPWWIRTSSAPTRAPCSCAHSLSARRATPTASPSSSWPTSRCRTISAASMRAAASRSATLNRNAPPPQVGSQTLSGVRPRAANAASSTADATPGGV